MIDSNNVFDAVRRGYNELEISTNAEIINYFSDVNESSMTGHISNIKGILFEQQYVEQLTAKGIEAEIFEATSHPVTDISILEDGEIINEFQLKATDSVSYINATLDSNPDVAIITTSEVAASFDSDMVIDSGIEEEILEDAVVSSLADDVVNPVSAISVISWIFGGF